MEGKNLVDHNIHKGHRDRLRNKFIKNGIESLEQHEVLELLLFYAVPQKSTNDIAHELLNRFGNIKELFDAPIESICKTKNVGYSAAVLFKLIPQLLRYYLITPDKKQSLDNYEYYLNYFNSMYVGTSNEQFRVCCLNNSLQVISCDKLSEGTPSEVAVSARMVAEAAFRANSSIVVLAHNHPNALPVPSKDDIRLTNELINSLKAFDIKVLDHVIVGKGEVHSMRRSGAIGMFY